MAYFMQHHWPTDTTMPDSDVMVVDQVKMFRNLAEIRFERRIHEQVLPSIRRLGGQIERTNVFVVHSGGDTSPEGRARKHERDLRLLQLELADMPDDGFTRFNLGMTLAAMKRHDDAVNALLGALERAKPDDSFAPKAFSLLVSNLFAVAQIEAAMRACDEGKRAFPNDRELLFWDGVLSEHRGDWKRAVDAYNRVLQANSSAGPMHADRRLESKARHNLAIAQSRIGRD
jgi:tetratricopeptide (TPR) repeat protein